MVMVLTSFPAAESSCSVFCTNSSDRPPPSMANTVVLLSWNILAILAGVDSWRNSLTSIET